MRITIEASSQEEYEDKLDELVKSLKGEPEIRRSIYRAQNEMVDHWDNEFKKMLHGLKDDISKILLKKG